MNYLYLFILFFLPISLLGQETSAIANVTVLMQNGATLRGDLVREHANSIHLRIEDENYMLKKKNIAGIVPNRNVDEFLGAGDLKKDLIVLKNKFWLSADILEINDKTLYLKGEEAVHFLKLNEVENIYPKGQEIALLSDLKNEEESAILVSKFKRDFLKKGIYHIVYGNISFGNDGENPRNTMGVGGQYIFGYQFSQRIGLGLGLGYLDYFNDSFFGDEFSSGPQVIPIFTEIRGYFSDKNTSAYYNLALGVATGTPIFDNLPTELRPGLYTHPAIGYKVGSDRAAFMIDLGLQITDLKYTVDFFGDKQTLVFELERLVLRLGMMF